MARGNCRQAAAREDWQIDDATEGWEAAGSVLRLAELIAAITVHAVAVIACLVGIHKFVPAARARAIHPAVGLRRCRRSISVPHAIIALFAGIDLIVATEVGMNVTRFGIAGVRQTWVQKARLTLFV